MDRQPAVAGQFYPGSEKQLRETIEGFVPKVDRHRALGIVSPHAGYVYSGAIAGETFSQVQVTDRVIIIGPNHHGFGHPGAVSPEGGWQTPLGRSAIDSELARRIVERCPLLKEDAGAHQFEHSLEVQLPFIQFLNPLARIVPICLGHLNLGDLMDIGATLGDLLNEEKEDVLIVASSDMTHYESGEAAREKDMAAIEHITALDPEGLFNTVKQRRISMCGVMPTVVMLAACKKMGAGKASLVRYGNSGDVTGDQREVVGYAGVLIE